MATDLIPMSLMLMLPSEMDSVLLQSSKQRNLLEYFADSFFEEGTGQETTSSLSGDTAVANHSPGGGGVEGVTITQPPHSQIWFSRLRYENRPNDKFTLFYRPSHNLFFKLLRV